MAQKNMNICFQLGTKLKSGKKIGVAAHVMVNIFIDMVLNLSAKYAYCLPEI